ncbi:hypothetical protein QTI66_36035 [Variovorax sp. J22R133]|uniref:hypothetical protein n=1 Tax=Variovorax brevis TaxID=3053503 RepID=UPI0025785B1A|nr:hypothetical protein [Variovorax sp. J22R133]MDM0117526.1 hypothetical protein [Variovorax sp. J22R133]
MFTDNPTIPAQLEVLLDVLYAMRDRKVDRATVRTLIQPQGLMGIKSGSQQVDLHFRAAQELMLVRLDDAQNIRLSYQVRGEHRAREMILDAFDRIALANSEVEPWAGRFYAFLIGQQEDVASQSSDSQGDWALRFMSAIPSTVPRDNQMNADKFRALMRWYVYAGMGWIDPSDSFVPDPSIRLRRALTSIWPERKPPPLDSSEFMNRLATACPELDGGVHYCEMHPNWRTSAARKCTRALATALWRLHDEGQVRLHCPADSLGWSLELGGVGVIPGEQSNRFDKVEFLTTAKERA